VRPRAPGTDRRVGQRATPLRPPPRMCAALMWGEGKASARTCRRPTRSREAGARAAACARRQRRGGAMWRWRTGRGTAGRTRGPSPTARIASKPTRSHGGSRGRTGGACRCPARRGTAHVPRPPRRVPALASRQAPSYPVPAASDSFLSPLPFHVRLFQFHRIAFVLRSCNSFIYFLSIEGSTRHVPVKNLFPASSGSLDSWSLQKLGKATVLVRALVF